MKHSVLFIYAVLFFLLTACTSQPPQAGVNDLALNATETEQELDSAAMPLPNLYHMKNGKRLKMVRIMEGGACKNDQEGVVGMFMLYANPDEIETISQSRGEEVFSEFDLLLEEIAMDALSRAVDELEFDEGNPFALDEDELARTLAMQLIAIFELVIADDIAAFEQNNGVTIDLIPLEDSLYFYRDGCEMSHEH